MRRRCPRVRGPKGGGHACTSAVSRDDRRGSGVNVPRIVIAAPASGHGKTTVVTGLLAAFRARGLRTAGFKVGPDYIDPTYHALACGRPGRNLDPVLIREATVAPLFAYGASDAQVAVIDGVMGLYDGPGHAGHDGSTAQVV